MEMDGIDTIAKTRDFVMSQLDGFDEFTNEDTLWDMGILTDEFFSSLISFLEETFNVTISKNELYKDTKYLSITSIGKFIEQKKKMKRKSDLIYDIIMCLVCITGTQVLPIEVELLENLPYWNDDLEEEFKEQLTEKFNIDLDLSKLKPLTLVNIADYIEQEQACDLRGGDRNSKNRKNQNTNLQVVY